MDAVAGFLRNNIWLLGFIVLGLPFGYYRSKFRKIVYRTDSWFIVIKPVFVKEVKALIGNIYPDDPDYLHMRNFYRIFLVIYTALFAAWSIMGSAR